MARDELKKRIEALNRKPLKNTPAEDSLEMRALRRKLEKSSHGQRAAESGVAVNAPARRASTEPIIYSRDIRPARRTEAAPIAAGDAAPISLLEAFERLDADIRDDGGFCLLQKRADLLEAESAVLHWRFLSLTGHPDGEAVERIAELCRSKRITPEEALFLDIETTGLGTTPLFLIGTMGSDGEAFHFSQYFARDYSEEAAVVSAISGRLGAARLLVTFNGKSFDIPYIQGRAAAMGVAPASVGPHLDLLHESRRHLRDCVPNCQLRTLEAIVCGRTRDDDIPGSEIPAAYHDFVRTGDASKIHTILLHNLYDLLTMADLMARIYRCE